MKTGIWIEYHDPSADPMYEIRINNIDKKYIDYHITLQEDGKRTNEIKEWCNKNGWEYKFWYLIK